MPQSKGNHKKPRKPKKFRFQFVHAWLVNNFEPLKVADVGGGKGLLSYLLIQDGWFSEVIDPLFQELNWKYKSLEGKRIKLEDRNAVKRRTEKFSPDIVKDFDLIVGLHLHGANMQIVESCKKYEKDFLLLPCCVIDEPITKEFGINWRDSLQEYAEGLGFDVKKVQFNFKGKNIAIYSDRLLIRKPTEQIDLEINKKILNPQAEFNREWITT